jgi:hypothetical protein
MARRSRKLLITGVVNPTDLGRTVVGNYIEKAKKDLNKWTDKYTSKINEFTNNKVRIDSASARLGVWYDVYASEVYPKIKGLYETAKVEYARRVVKPVATAPV